ncbi:MAG: hypothetical protein QOH07_1450, partial [Mycobacterium sp.]|nr:hypothetical protein [Mycobacterium sp.]
EEREDVADWLNRNGWDVTATPSDELMASYGRPRAQGLEEASPMHLFVSAQRADS